MPESHQMQFLPSPLVLILRMILSCLPALVGIDVREYECLFVNLFSFWMLFPCDEVCTWMAFFKGREYQGVSLCLSLNPEVRSYVRCSVSGGIRIG